MFFVSPETNCKSLVLIGEQGAGINEHLPIYLVEPSKGEAILSRNAVSILTLSSWCTISAMFVF